MREKCKLDSKEPLRSCSCELMATALEASAERSYWRTGNKLDSPKHRFVRHPPRIALHAILLGCLIPATMMMMTLSRSVAGRSRQFLVVLRWRLQTVRHVVGRSTNPERSKQKCRGCRNTSRQSRALEVQDGESRVRGEPPLDWSCRFASSTCRRQCHSPWPPLCSAVHCGTAGPHSYRCARQGLPFYSMASNALSPSLCFAFCIEKGQASWSCPCHIH